MCATRLFRISAANIGPNRFHQNRTVSWLMSIPRSAKRSSTLRSDSGYFTYISTARRIISGELLNSGTGCSWLKLPQPKTTRKIGLTMPRSGPQRHGDVVLADAMAAYKFIETPGVRLARMSGERGAQRDDEPYHFRQLLGELARKEPT